VPGFALYGMGIGFAGAQLTNVVMSDIPPESSGSASGANTTVRQVGMALGVAVIGALLTTTTISHATKQVNASTASASTKASADTGIHDLGLNYVPPAHERDDTATSTAVWTASSRAPHRDDVRRRRGDRTPLSF
jgi:hypothetical protein